MNSQDNAQAAVSPDVVAAIKAYGNARATLAVDHGELLENLLAAIAASLLDEALRVLQHDTGEHDPEYAHLRSTLGKLFWKVLLPATAPCVGADERIAELQRMLSGERGLAEIWKQRAEEWCAQATQGADRLARLEEANVLLHEQLDTARETIGALRGGGADGAPFANCRYQICDFPGQCKGEGHCHHPENGERGQGADDARHAAQLLAELVGWRVECPDGCASDRYRVARRETKLSPPYTVLCGTATREVFTGSHTSCLDIACELTTAFLDGLVVAACPGAPRTGVIIDVLTERKRQDAQWGGPEHDDRNTKTDWQNLIYRQHYAASSFAGTPEEYRVRLVKLAALAVAAIESIDRVLLAASMRGEKS